MKTKYNFAPYFSSDNSNYPSEVHSGAAEINGNLVSLNYKGKKYEFHSQEVERISCPQVKDLSQITGRHWRYRFDKDTEGFSNITFTILLKMVSLFY